MHLDGPLNDTGLRQLTTQLAARGMPAHGVRFRRDGRVSVLIGCAPDTTFDRSFLVACAAQFGVHLVDD